MTGDQNKTGGGGSKGRPHRSLSGEPRYSSLVLKLLPWSASTQFASTPSRKALGACPSLQSQLLGTSSRMSPAALCSVGKSYFQCDSFW